MTEPELKPLDCPCCNSVALVDSYLDDALNEIYRVYCSNCGLNIKRNIENSAIELWNSRILKVTTYLLNQKYSKAIEFLKSINVPGEHPVRKLLRELGEE